MSSFIDDVKAVLDDKKILTENGATAYATSGKELLDLNFSVFSLRGESDQEIENRFVKAYFENPRLAVLWMFFARDVRGGMGERRLFRVCYRWLAANKTDIAVKLIPLVQEYGRFDDLFAALNVNDVFHKAVVGYIGETLSKDYDLASECRPCSLLAKWMPSVNTSSPEARGLALSFAKDLNMKPAEYRKTLSRIRGQLDLVETKASSNEWSKIDYEKVPSKANLKYKTAFDRHDHDRREAFLSKVVNGEAKINSATAFPCDIVFKYVNAGCFYDNSVKPYDATLEGMWKNLPDYVKDVDNGNTLVVSDGSGSMTQLVGGTKMSALEVAQSLAIYFSERMSNSPFKDKFISFSAEPTLIDLSNATTLHDKLEIISRYNDCYNTNLEAVLDLLLDTAVKNNTPQKDIPNLLIASDMQFDRMVYVGDSEKTLMENMEAKWKAAGYRLPRITYWAIAANGGGRSNPIPVQTSESGIALISGFSPALASMVYSSKTDPYEVLVEKLESERYKKVSNLLVA